MGHNDPIYIDLDFDDIFDECDSCADCDEGCHDKDGSWTIREEDCEDCDKKCCKKKCECGADACGSPKHSEYCPKYEEE